MRFLSIPAVLAACFADLGIMVGAHQVPAIGGLLLGLTLLVSVVIGLSYGATIGGASASVGFVLAIVVLAVWLAARGQSLGSIPQIVTAVVVAVLFLGFTAWFAGALRERYAGSARR